MCSLAFSQNGRIPLTPTATKSGSLQSNSMSGFSTTFSFSSIESQSISNEKGSFSEIYIDGSFPYGEVGSPSLPMVTRMIAIPQGATPVVTVNGYSEREYALSDYDINTLSAKQAPVAKNIDPTTVEYVVNEAAYARNTYTTDEIASVEYLGTMCGLRLGKLTIRPVAYNAAENTIKVCNDINVTVDFENANAALTQSMFASTYSPAFNSIYDQLLNKSMFGQSTIKGVYDTHTDMYHTPVKMLVICYSGFRNNSVLNQWLAWKLQKGYYVDIFYTDETGTTSANIANFIKTKYNASVSSGNAYSYLITIGDTDQVQQYKTNSVSEDQCATDIGYSSIDYATNSDYYPEMLYSRISVETTTQLENYLNKVLTYEKYEFADGGNYLNNVKIIGGWDDDWTEWVAAPTVTYASTYYFNTTNTIYGGFENGNVSTITSTSSSAGFSGTNNGVYSGINDGFCFLNYTAHGNIQQWYQPNFTAKQAETLTNTGKYFFAVGNCCLTGNFNNTGTTNNQAPSSAIGTKACFAEAMIRVPNAGAIAYVGNSPVSYWFEDFYWAVGSGVSFNTVGSGWSSSYQIETTPTTSNTTMGVYDAMFTDEYWNSVSSLLNIGDIAVASAHESGNETSIDANYYWLYYHAFGDGSIMPYITKPEANTVTLPASLMTGATSMTVNAVAGSYVAVTDNESTIYGVAVANSSGVATVNFTETIPATGTLYVVVTRQQYQPYFGTVAVIAPNPPTADFTGTPTTILERESVTFTNNSQYAATYLWNFGDGETSTEANPVHTYMTPGTYTVSLRVENTLGNDTKTRTNYITVNANTNPPVADFEASETEISTGTTITFTDLTENIVTSWSWTFEGGTPATSTEQNPTVTYDEPGEYTVTLTATNAYGSDVETKTAYINVFYPEIVMSNDDITVCGGTYKDPGGDGNYGNNANYTQTIYPSTDGAMVRLTFTSFSLQAASSGWGGTTTCSDKFYIYDGTSASATALVDGVCGTSNPGTVTATNAAGALTIVFTSNNRTVSTGWEAEISCYVPDAEVAVQSYTPTTANYNTTNDLNVTFVNQGGRATGANTTATLSTTDEYLTLNTTTATLGTMAHNATANGTFNFTIAENVPDGHVATINVEITDGSSTWNETLTITAVGPACDAPTGLQVAVNNTDATISWDTYTVVNNTISDDFEGHTHGTINSAGTVGWTYIDGDNTATASFSTVEFTNEGSKIAFIALDVNQVEVTSTNVTLTAHSGNMILVSPYISSRVANNDWIISPELNFSQPFTFSFYARSAHATYSTEQFYAAYSTTGNSANNFINLENSATTTTTTWTEYTYTVPANAKYVAIHCVSSDQYMFCIDDITISEIIESGTEFVNIYDNGVLIASNVSGGTYTATNLSVGEHCFSVRAVCNDDSESLAVQQCVTIENSLPSYTVTVNSNNGGTVSPNGTQTVTEGNNFTFTATPNDCYEVASVTVDGNNVNLTNNQYTLSNVTANHTVNVTFSQISYTIAATAGNGGTITPNGNTTVNCGENKTFAIAANAGYRISNVTVDGQNMGAIESYTFSNVDANHTISATFIAVLTIDVTADAEGGSVSPTGTQTIDEGGSFTFTVTPETCYEIGNVTVNGTAVTLDANNQYTINNITSNQIINVTFNQLSYTITATAGNGGTINPGTTTVNCGGSQTYTIVPSEDYMISAVTVDGQSVGSVSSYSFTNVTADHTISATFVEIPDNHIVVVVNADTEGGTVNPTGSQSIEQGSDFTFTVTPDACYTIGSVTVNGTLVELDANNSYTISNVTTEQTINVTFNRISYTITASAGNGGTITPAGNVDVNCGESMTFAIAASEGYQIADVLVDGVSVGVITSYTFDNVTENGHSISATFEAIPANVIEIVVNADAEGGSVSPTGTQTVTEGDDFTFTVTPDACYTIGTVTVNGTPVELDANNSYTIPNVTTEQAINVTFNQIVYTIAASAENGGTITPAGDVEVNCGADAVFTITPDEGYDIADVIVDGQSAINDIASYSVIGASASYTFNSVTENGHSIVATFRQIAVEECNTVTNLEVSVEPYGNLISWTAAENAVSYNIFRNDEETALANISTTSYVDMNGQSGDTYYIVTVCQYGESDPSESVQAIQTGIDGSNISVEIYPNPASDKFMIECEGMTTIEIFNVVGQSMGMIDVNSNAISVESSTWTSGVYNVRITTENAGTIVKQIIKQ